MVQGMRLIVLLVASVVAPSVLTAAGGGAPLRAASKVDGVGSARTPDGEVKLELREIHTRTTLPDIHADLGVLVLFEPKSGAFSWRIAPADVNPSWRTLEFIDSQVAFLKDGKIFDFRAIEGGPRLIIHESRGSASSIEDAETQALKAAGDAIEHRGFLDIGQNAHVLSLLNLDRDFTIPPMSVATSIMPKVTEVRWDADAHHWVVTLEARWTEAITLDADFNVVSMRKVE
jgi:hypothetical protein